MSLLERQGVVTREAVNAEGIIGGFAGVYAVLKALEEAGKVRRGWFVATLGAAQFGTNGPIERLRTARDTAHDTSADVGVEKAPTSTAFVLSAVDPAQPYGAVIPWPEHAHGHPSRSSGADVVIVNGFLVAFIERGGKSITTYPTTSTDDAHASALTDVWIIALVQAVMCGRVGALQIQTINGAPVRESAIADALRKHGFADGYKG